MAIGNILGNIGMGLVRGDQLANEETRRANEDARRANEDKRSAEAAAFMQEQRGWQRQDRSKADELETALKGVRPAGDYVDPMAEAEGREGPGLPKISRSDADVFRDYARVYQGRGKPGEAAQLVTTARNERDGQRKDEIDAQSKALFGETGEMYADLLKGDLNAFKAKWGGKFNANLVGGPQFNDHKIQWNSDGTKAFHQGPDGTVMREMPWNLQTARSLVDQYLETRMMGLSESHYNTAVDRGLRRRQVDAQTTTAEAAMRKAAADEGYKDVLASRPNVQTDGSGRIVVLSSDGKTVLGTHGAARPVAGGVGLLRERAADYTEAILNSGEINPATKKPFTPEEAKRYAYGTVLKDVNNKNPRPTSIKDLKEFVEAFGDSPSKATDTKTGLPIPIRKLSPEEQRAEMNRFLGGGESDVGGAPAVAPPKRVAPGAQKAAPQDLGRATQEMLLSQQLQRLKDLSRNTQQDSMSHGLQPR